MWAGALGALTLVKPPALGLQGDDAAQKGKIARWCGGEAMDAYATPLIALAGTLAVALIGLYQWRRQRQDSRASAPLEARRRAYENLWLKLEEIHIKLREEAPNPTLFELLREVNTFFLQNSLWFEDKEQKVINEYVTALDRLRTAVYEEGDEETVHAWCRTWFEVPDDVAEEIRVASDEVLRLRDEAKSMVRRVVGV